MRALGLELGHLADLLEKKITLPEFKEGLERDIVNYAKRQMRWFKREKDIMWFDPKEKRKILSALR
jgi:tRNA dimethylallyltransferase